LKIIAFGLHADKSGFIVALLWEPTPWAMGMGHAPKI
jgi:hypothetical protein